MINGQHQAARARNSAPKSAAIKRTRCGVSSAPKLDPRQPGAVDRKIGALLRERRQRLGMSQKCLAKLLGVTFQQVQKYENGTNRITLARAADAARHLGTDVSKLVPAARQVRS